MCLGNFNTQLILCCYLVVHSILLWFILIQKPYPLYHSRFYRFIVFFKTYQIVVLFKEHFLHLLIFLLLACSLFDCFLIFIISLSSICFELVFSFCCNGYLGESLCMNWTCTLLSLLLFHKQHNITLYIV